MATKTLGFELLESKLRPPQDRLGSVSRERLISGLEGPRAPPVVVVSAGPGWGKTTLLAQWASRSDRPFAWVDVDENDNDPIVLLTYLAVALDRISPLDPRVFDALASPGVSIEATVVPRLGAALASMDRDVVLALDDLHLLDNPVCLDAVAVLARHVPPGSQLALSARGAPTLPLAASRARGLALEIGPDQLRLDETEARELLTAAGLDLPQSEVAALTEGTEGWSAGLYLAALSIRARQVKDAAVPSFSGRDPRVSDYLQSELLAHLAPDVFRFLTRTAVLERMTGPLCDAVLDDEGSAAMLDELARSNLFLVPLDSEGQAYRYHHLFQDLLRAELVRAEPDLLAPLLARAADWCVGHGQPEAAIGYAQDAGDVARVARLFERWAQPAYQSGRVTTVERWIRWLEQREALEQNAAVAVLAAFIAAVGGHPAEADRLADIAERASFDGELPDGSSSIEAWRAALNAVHCARGIARMRADAELAVRTLGPSSQFRPTALMALGVAYLLAGDVDRADDAFADSVEEGLELGAVEAAAVSGAERAAAAIEKGAWGESDELVGQAVLVIRRARMEEYPGSAFAFAVAARVALHRGEPDRAQELLSQAQRLRPRLTYALPWAAVQTRLELASAYLTMADTGGARTMLREIDALLRRRPELGTLASRAKHLRASLLTMRAGAPGASTLTTAELRVIPYLGTHLTFREIGARLFISHHTVKSHAMAIYRKLSVSSRSEAVERAREFGLL